MDRANLRWLLTRLGPVGLAGLGQHLGCSGEAVRQRGGVIEASRDLFPDLDVVIAYRLLFGIYSGIVPDGIDDLVVADIDWAGDSTILLSYVKGRTAGESLTLPRRAVRLLEQWLAHSSLLRSHVAPSDRGQLWLRLRTAGGATVSGQDRRRRASGRPTVGDPPPGGQRRRRTLEDPPVPDPDHPPVPARQEQLGRTAGEPRSTPTTARTSRATTTSAPPRRRSGRRWRPSSRTPSMTCCAGRTHPR